MANCDIWVYDEVPGILGAVDGPRPWSAPELQRATESFGEQDREHWECYRLTRAYETAQPARRYPPGTLVMYDQYEVFLVERPGSERQ